MPEVTPREQLTVHIDQFTDSLTSLAREIVRRLLEDELRSRRRGVAGRDGAKTRRTSSRSKSLRRGGQTNGEKAAVPATPMTRVPRGSGAWTPDKVLDDLSTWLLGGTTDAAFISQHGRKGLAAAAKRFFGRFDAALNAANLRLAKRHPAGIPTPAASRTRLPALRRGAHGG